MTRTKMKISFFFSIYFYSTYTKYIYLKKKFLANHEKIYIRFWKKELLSTLMVVAVERVKKYNDVEFKQLILYY